ncbi:34514_t:CDS:2 [Gigaspora margarita]|uniref:34514_t:CDS:1 n=1 Tax=Gigaspora margarita TaxID=4874 RepID=A0ABN7UR12_GIGMA|nr:34514_t:CDS:2 [Gigaspora margarita]
MVNAQEYIENNFSKHSRIIDVANKNLVGSLDLSEYSNLEELVILTNQITDLIFSEKDENITKIEAYNNHLISLNFLISLPNPEKLKWLGVFQNQITSNDLEVLAPFVNCEMLSIGKNNIHGHLSSLRYWTSLKRLDLVGIKPQVNGLDYIAHNPFSGVSGISGQFNQDYPPKTINEFNNNTWRGSNNFRKLSNDKVCEIINNLWQQSQQLKRQVQSQSQELNKLKNEQSQEFDKLKQQYQELEKQLEQLVKKAKTKADDPKNMLDKFLETQKQISKTKPEKELQNLLNEQTELFQLEEHLASLQINEVSNSQ